MSKIWVLAADASQARLFTREKKFSPLNEVQVFVHPESRLHRRDLERDRPGQVFESKTPGENTSEEPTDPKKREADEFAREVAARLRTARARGEFESLAIVAAPSFLGLLRAHMDAETRRLVSRAVSRNITREAPEVIAGVIDAED